MQADFPLIPEANAQYVNEKQLLDYRKHREKFINWLLTFGKDPEGVEGYSQDTAKRTAYRCAKFDRWAWKRNDGYYVPLTQEAADEYLKHIAYEDYSDTHRHKVLNSLKRYFRWRQREYNEPEWEPGLIGPSLQEAIFNNRNVMIMTRRIPCQAGIINLYRLYRA